MEMDQGRQKQVTDEASWHLLALDRQGRVCGCVRYRHHENSATYRDLASKLRSGCPGAGPKPRVAIESELKWLVFVISDMRKWAAGPLRKSAGEPWRLKGRPGNLQPRPDPWRFYRAYDRHGMLRVFLDSTENGWQPHRVGWRHAAPLLRPP